MDDEKNNFYFFAYYLRKISSTELQQVHISIEKKERKTQNIWMKLVIVSELKQKKLLFYEGFTFFYHYLDLMDFNRLDQWPELYPAINLVKSATLPSALPCIFSLYPTWIYLTYLGFAKNVKKTQNHSTTLPIYVGYMYSNGKTALFILWRFRLFFNVYLVIDFINID